MVGGAQMHEYEASRRRLRREAMWRRNRLASRVRAGEGVEGGHKEGDNSVTSHFTHRKTSQCCVQASRLVRRRNVFLQRWAE
jgi:hypothetical protein